MHKKFTHRPILIVPLLIITIALTGCYAKKKYAKQPSVSDQKLRTFTETIRKIDGRAEAHYRMALFFQKDSRYKLAIAELQKALESNPYMAKAYNAMGVSFDKLGEYDQAIRSYFAALKLDPKLDYAHNNLGYSQLLKGDFPKAIKAFRHAIRLNSENKRYHNNLALAYVMDEQYDLAAEQFKIVDQEMDANRKVADLVNKIGQKTPPRLTRKPSGRKKTRIAAGPHVIKKKLNPTGEKFSAEVAMPSANEPAVVMIGAGERNNVAQITVTPAARANPGESSSITVVSGTRSVETPRQAVFTSPPVTRPINRTANSDAALAYSMPPLQVSAVLTAEDSPPRPVTVTQPSPAIHVIGDGIEAEDKKTRAPKIVEGKQVFRAPLSLKQPYFKKRRVEVAAAKSTATPVRATARPKRPTGAFEIELEIANGNGVTGMARKVGRYLQIRGFKVTKISNARSFDHVSSKVLYSSDGKKSLDRLLGELNIIKEASNLIELERLGNRIRVVVGKDMLALRDQLDQKHAN